MQAKKRYILVFVSCAFLAYCYFGGYRLKRTSNTFTTQLTSSTTTSLGRKEHINVPLNLPSFLTITELNGLIDENIVNKIVAQLSSSSPPFHNHLQINQNTIHPGSEYSVNKLRNNTKAKGMMLKHKYSEIF